MRRRSLSGWLVVAVIGPPVCFAFGTAPDGAAGFAFAWSAILACAGVLAAGDGARGDGLPRAALRRPHE